MMPKGVEHKEKLGTDEFPAGESSDDAERR